VTPPESGPLLSAGFWLQQAALAWRSELEKRLHPLGLTATQFTVLGAVGWLEHTAGPPTQQEVAEQAGANRMMTSKVVRTLHQRGLLVPHAHESDARALRLALTATGRTTIDDATHAAARSTRPSSAPTQHPYAPHYATSPSSAATSTTPRRGPNPRDLVEMSSYRRSTLVEPGWGGEHRAAEPRGAAARPTRLRLGLAGSHRPAARHR